MADHNMFDLDVTRNEFVIQGQGDATGVTPIIATSIIGMTSGCIIITSYLAKCNKERLI